jgi:hypothetical protein
MALRRSLAHGDARGQEFVDMRMQQPAVPTVDIGEHGYGRAGPVGSKGDEPVVIQRGELRQPPLIARLLGEVAVGFQVDGVAVDQVAPIAGNVSDHPALRNLPVAR